MSKKDRVVEKTATGFNVKPDPQTEAKKAKAKDKDALTRIEAKLDLLLDKLDVTL